MNSMYVEMTNQIAELQGYWGEVPEEFGFYAGMMIQGLLNEIADYTGAYNRDNPVSIGATTIEDLDIGPRIISTGQLGERQVSGDDDEALINVVSPIVDMSRSWETFDGAFLSLHADLLAQAASRQNNWEYGGLVVQDGSLFRRTNIVTSELSNRINWGESLYTLGNQFPIAALHHLHTTGWGQSEPKVFSNSDRNSAAPYLERRNSTGYRGTYLLGGGELRVYRTSMGRDVDGRFCNSNRLPC